MNAVVETEPLDAIREQIATLTAELHRLGSERERCLAEAEGDHTVADAAGGHKSDVSSNRTISTGMWFSKPNTLSLGLGHVRIGGRYPNNKAYLQALTRWSRLVCGWHTLCVFRLSRTNGLTLRPQLNFRRITVNTFIVRDLSIDQKLDRKAMAAMRGGISTTCLTLPEQELYDSLRAMGLPAGTVDRMLGFGPGPMNM
jgi:hypothetical protein